MRLILRLDLDFFGINLMMYLTLKNEWWNESHCAPARMRQQEIQSVRV